MPGRALGGVSIASNCGRAPLTQTHLLAMTPGTKVHVYQAGNYNRRGEVVAAEPVGKLRVRLDTGEAISVHRADLEEIRQTKPIDLRPCRDS